MNGASVWFLVLPPDLILDPLPVSLCFSLLLDVDFLSLRLAAKRLLIPLLSMVLSWSLLVVHSVESSVEAAIMLWYREVFLAHSVREVAVAASQAASVAIAFLATRRTRVGHWDVGGTCSWLPGRRILWSGLVAGVGKAAL